MTRPAKNQPGWVCLDCGKKHGAGKGNDICTVHEGTCGVCGKTKAVSEPRDFGYLREGWER